MDFAAIASAIALRFDATTITPPTGYNDVALSTHRLPNAITSLPTALVFPSEDVLAYGPGRRSGDLVHPVRFYVEAAADRPRAMDALYAWKSVLIDQVEGNFDLDQSASGHVTHATITSAGGGPASYGGQDYVALEFSVNVHIVQAISPTT